MVLLESEQVAHAEDRQKLLALFVDLIQTETIGQLEGDHYLFG